MRRGEIPPLYLEKWPTSHTNLAEVARTAHQKTPTKKFHHLASRGTRAMSQKLAVAGFVTALTGAVAYTTVYLPFFSDAAKTRRDSVLAGQVHVPKASPGSVRANVQAAAEAKK